MVISTYHMHGDVHPVQVQDQGRTLAAEVVGVRLPV
jgi:hypothetical protein